MLRRQIVLGSLFASILAIPIPAEAMDPLIPKGEPVGLIVEGDSFRLYYPVPKRKPLEFEAQGPGIVLLYAVNHRRGKRRASSVIEVRRNGKLWKRVRLGCGASSTQFADTKGRDRPCARTSQEIKVGAGKVKISVRLIRSRYGASVAPHFVSERELGLEPALVGLDNRDKQGEEDKDDAADEEITAAALPPPPPPPPPVGDSAATPSVDPAPGVDSEAVAESTSAADSTLEVDPENSQTTTDTSTVLDGESPPELASKGELLSKADTRKDSPILAEKIVASAEDDDGWSEWMAPAFSYLGSVAALGAGLYFAKQYDDSVESAEMASVQLDRQAFLDEADDHALVANISYGVAGAAALLGTYFLLDIYWLSSDKESSDVSTTSSGVGAACGAGGCEARLWFDF